jgi:hypothetical protein
MCADDSFPSWTMKVQIMSEKQAEEAWEQKRINVFDLTHVWPHGDYPLRTIGKFTLNENAKVSSILMSTRSVLMSELLCRGRAGCIQPFPHGPRYRAIQ